ncbi:hypothetical protein [Variovorax saccharolyticus]|uniref:hypothetical protein n=1 Tax=Variovorax saccharolyticus TaxID=3053516 RepID=UPI002578D36D|nr:hypothetical protein [Variovorax sp. J31P216]MDM0027865.1 hypothetical protein [Variovorax sp. J31P216]
MASQKKEAAKTDGLKDAGGGDTKVAQGGESAPRLPHEHDQSSDSQANQDGGAPRVGREAHADVERGLVDTDKGPVTDRVYNDKLKP